MSMLLALQLYVAHMLSLDPSHLENAASDAYVGSHVCRTLQRPVCALQLVSHPSAQNSVNRQLGIASVNAYKPLALLCFFIEVPSCPHVHPSRILSPNISCAAVAHRPCRHLPTSLLGVFLISLASLLGVYACLPLTCKPSTACRSVVTAAVKRACTRAPPLQNHAASRRSEARDGRWGIYCSSIHSLARSGDRVKS